MPRYAQPDLQRLLVVSPERKLLQTLIDASQASVNGWVRAQALQGQRDRSSAASRRPIRCSTRPSPPSRTTRGAYDQKDAGGFIKLNALRMRIAAMLARKRS